MTAQEMRALMIELGENRTTLTALLGYASDASIRQIETGKQALPAGKAEWLRAYRQFRRGHDAKRAALDRAHEQWLHEHPVP